MSDKHMEAARDLFEDPFFRPFRNDHCIREVATALLQARQEGMREAAKICDEVKRSFLSPEYASPQPIGSFSERFACEECARAILKAIEEA